MQSCSRPILSSVKVNPSYLFCLKYVVINFFEAAVFVAAVELFCMTQRNVDIISA